MKKKYYYDSHFYFGAYANTGLKDLSTGGYIGGYIKNFNIATIINGDLDELIDALVTMDQAEKLKNNEN